MNDDPIWYLRHRPKTVQECILPKNLKETFLGFINKGEFPHLILEGPPGRGKTTVAEAMLNQLGYEVYFVNSSLQNSITDLRNDIMNFASTVSFEGKRKAVILDEADRLSRAMQEGLRSFMETMSGNCSFILTVNNINGIIDPIKDSRCFVVSFQYPPTKSKDGAALQYEFFNHAIKILNKEGVTYDKSVLAQIVYDTYPNWRKILVDLQAYASKGPIDTGIFVDNDVDLASLFESLKKKNYTMVRSWVSSRYDLLEPNSFFRAFYTKASDYVEESSVPPLIVLIGKYQYQATRVADQEINIAAFLAEIMYEVTFK